MLVLIRLPPVAFPAHFLEQQEHVRQKPEAWQRRSLNRLTPVPLRAHLLLRQEHGRQKLEAWQSQLLIRLTWAPLHAHLPLPVKHGRQEVETSQSPLPTRLAHWVLQVLQSQAAVQVPAIAVQAKLLSRWSSRSPPPAEYLNSLLPRQS